LVSESGGTFDVAEPEALAAATTAVAGARLEKPLPRAVESARQIQAAAPRETVLTSLGETIPDPDHPALRATGALEPKPASARGPTPSWPISSTPAPRAVATPTASSPARTADRGQPGWLSNLLAAASRDEPEEATSTGEETLEALSREIPGFIDNEAAVEMWDRWRRGDTGAVSRRLYTEAGQKAFDEIRRRYRADPQFRDTTTRYIQEFERLLAKISHSDRDGSQWRAYLLSNTGKVYTILAHASGRLG
jgi:hypothetical protein